MATAASVAVADLNDGRLMVEEAIQQLDASVAFLQQPRNFVSGPMQVMATQANDIVTQLTYYLVIAWAYEVKQSIDSQKHIFGVAALFLVADYISSFVKWRVEQAASQPEFQRRTLAGAVVRALGLLVTFLGFIMVRLLIDNFQRQTQFSRRSTLVNFIMPATLFALLYINQVFSGYYSLGAQGAWSDRLERSWRMRRGQAQTGGDGS